MKLTTASMIAATAVVMAPCPALSHEDDEQEQEQEQEQGDPAAEMAMQQAYFTA